MIRRNMKRAVRYLAAGVLAGSILLLAGCNPSPEISACETFIKEKIATPATFKVVNASSLPSTGKGIRGLKPSDEIRLVTIEYDAENIYGAPIRKVDACVFPVRAGRLPPAQDMQGDAEVAGFGAKLRAIGPLEEADLIEKADALNRDERHYDCCIPSGSTDKQR